MYRTFGLATAACALAVAGCGGSSSSSNSSSSAATTSTPSTQTQPSGGAAAKGGAVVKVSADTGGALKFDKSTLSAKAGKVTIAMSNPAAVPHGVAVEGNGVDKTGAIVNQGGTSTITVSLKAGKYTFYCPVPGHRQAGMQGTLTVK